MSLCTWSENSKSPFPSSLLLQVPHVIENLIRMIGGRSGEIFKRECVASRDNTGGNLARKNVDQLYRGGNKSCYHQKLCERGMDLPLWIETKTHCVDFSMKRKIKFINDVENVLWGLDALHAWHHIRYNNLFNETFPPKVKFKTHHWISKSLHYYSLLTVLLLLSHPNKAVLASLKSRQKKSDVRPSPHHLGIKRILRIVTPETRESQHSEERDSGSGPPCLLPYCYCHMHAPCPPPLPHPLLTY